MTWNLRRKILAGYVIVMVLAGVVLGMALLNILRLGEASNAILQENYRSILAAEEMLGALERQENASLQLVLGADPATLAQFSEAEQRFLVWLARAKDNITIDGEPEILARIERGYSDYLYQLTHLRQIASEDHDQGLKLYDDELAPKAAAVRTACKQLHELNRRTMEASSLRASQVARSAVASTTFVAVAVLVGGIAFSMWLAGLIVRPITHLTEATEKVAAGDYHVAISAESTDEVGRLAEKFNVMVGQLRSYHELNLQRAAGERRKADAILKTIDDGVLVVDNHRKVASLNPAALKALGVPDGRVEGSDFATMIRDERLSALIDEALRSGRPPTPDDQRDFITVTMPDDRRLHYEYALTPIAGPDESSLGVIVLFRNVTKLKELDRLKTEFVMTASHELRTPLTSISMSIELLRERLGKSAAEADRQLLDVAHEELVRLRKLVEELLNLSKIESGKIEMEFAEVSLPALLQAAVVPFQSQAQRQGLELSVDVEQGVPPVKADANKLALVVTNLVGNALRYARSHIWVSAEPAGSWVNIYVRDDGPGIPHELQSRIFDKFVQVGDRQRAGGAGLGLAMSKDIVRAHGGYIWAESEPDRGSLFIVTLPGAPGSLGEKS